MLNKKALAGTPSTPPVFVEDVFSTYLYTGTGATQTITNGIDLAGKGGMVWTKSRSAVRNNNIVDTVRGGDNMVYTNDTGAQFSLAGLGFSPFTFSSTGFVESDAPVNAQSGATFCSWTFRKQPKFFDIVTYTGNGANRTIAHNLGSVPGSIWVKRTDDAGSWQVYHRSNTAAPETDYLVLNSTAATADSDTRWNDTLPTSTVFSLGTDATVNANTGTYVAYLFAHDDGGFGTASTDNVISCGSFTTDGSGKATVSLGYEPQWVLNKNTGAVDSWEICDSMRGMPSSGSNAVLFPNLSNAEGSFSRVLTNATGFKMTGLNATKTYIYIAIRRGPMKTPTSGTSVYNAIARTGTGAAATVTGVGFAPDVIWASTRDNAGDQARADKLRGFGVLRQDTSVQATPSETELTAYEMDGVTFGGGSGYWNATSTPYINWFFRRAPGFMDVVCYTGTGSNTTFSHNLGVVPELMIVKNRSEADDWAVYAGDNTDYLALNTTAATADSNTYWNDTSPTSTVFSVGTVDNTNVSAENYVAYLFATVAGVSKVGSYTGTAAAQTINCGFTAGARFVLIKRTDSTGDWYVWDTARGIVSGNDPYLLLNDTAAEVTNTDYIDPVNSGFELSSTAPAAINANGGSFIFMAIA